MGIFDHKKQTPEEVADEKARNFFDDVLREELRGRTRMYFDKIINENAQLFKEDLDKAIIQVYAELKEQLAKRVDEQFETYSHGLKEAQDAALKSLDRSVQALHEQHRQLGEKLKKSLTEQEGVMQNLVEESKSRMHALKESQEQTQHALDEGVKSLQEQQQQLKERLDKNVADQEAAAIKAFEDNMGRVVEHYLLGALGDQYDVKAQLPSIIKQLDDNKQAIVDDMKL